MKHLRPFLLSLTIAAAGSWGIQAEVVNDYIVDFDTEIETNAHDFKVAKGWSHIVDKYNDGYSDNFMSYSYKTTDGVGGSGCLQAGQQRAGDNWDYKDTYDLLVTPTVAGEISLQVKAMNIGTPWVEFYSITEDGKQGELLQKFSGISSDFSKVSLTLDDAQKVGIRAQYCYLDNFSAEVADVDLNQASAAIVSISPNVTGSSVYWLQQADGSMTVSYLVTVKNTDGVTLNPGDKNYTLSLLYNNVNYGNCNIPVSIAPEETSEPFVANFVLTKEQVAELWKYSWTSFKFTVRENVSGTSVTDSKYSYYKPWAVEMVFRVAGTNTTSSYKETTAFGTIKTAQSKEFEFLSNGSAPLKVVSISVPDGFSTNFPAEGAELAYGEILPVTLTMEATVAGKKSGNVVINYLDAEGATKTHVFPVSGSVVLGNTWFADFNNTETSIVWPAGSAAESGLNGRYTKSGSLYDYALAGYTNSDYKTKNNKFVTPLLHAEAGQEFTFDVSRDRNESTNKNEYCLKVYVTEDRYNLGEPVAVFKYDDVTAQTPGKIKFNEARNAYIVFEIYGMEIDNLIGLEKVEVARDLYFSSVNQPSDCQNGANVSVTANILPLTGLNADDYTVKLFVDGVETEGNGFASKSADAHSKNSTTISGNFTPSVETTSDVTFFLKLVFNDGTEFVSPSRTFKVTNESYFNFFNAGTSASNWYQPANRNTAIDFGRTNEANATQNFEIYNWGTAPLTVKGIRLPEGFKLTSEVPTSVAGKERAAVDIAFVGPELKNYSGNLEIDYLDGEGQTQTFTLEVKGTLLDSNKWRASFQSWPAGMVFQKNVSLTSGSDSYINSSSSASSSDRMVVTPKLHVEAGETLELVARLYNDSWTEGTIAVYTAATRNDLLDAENGVKTLVATLDANTSDDNLKLTTAYKNLFVTMPEEGDFYVGIEIASRAQINELYGLKLISDIRDLQLTSATVPTEAMQNVAKGATLSLLNFGIADEDAYTVTAFVGGEAQAPQVAPAVVPMAHAVSTAATEVPVTFRYPKVGTFPVYFEVKAGELTLATEPVEVTFAEETLSAEVQVGAAETWANQSPVNHYYNNSESIALYTPTDLGLSGGEKISKIAIRGYSRKDFTSKVLLAYQWSDETSEACPASGEFDYSAMTVAVNNDAYTWVNTGYSADNATDQIVIEFPTPITYESGKSLRLLVRSQKAPCLGNSDYMFEASNSTANCWRHQNDTALGNGTWVSDKRPVVHLSLVAEPVVFSGNVTLANGNAAVGATVTVISKDEDNVQYTATTDEYGRFSMQVIQNGRVYDVVTSLNGIVNVMEGVIFLNSRSMDIALAETVRLHNGCEGLEDKEGVHVIFDLEMEAGWNAVAFPLDLTYDELAIIFGEDVQLFSLEKVDGDTDVIANFMPYDEHLLPAGMPVLIYSAEDALRDFTFECRNIVATPQALNHDSVLFTATYSRRPASGLFLINEESYYSPIEFAAFAPAEGDESEEVLPFRAFFQAADGSAVNSVRFGINLEVGVGEVYSNIEQAEVYTLDGLRVKNPGKGLYIINGKKVILK